MIVLDARDNADRPKPQNHVEFKGDHLWLNPNAPMIRRRLNLDTVRSHMELSDEDNVPALFNFAEESWDVSSTDFFKHQKWWLGIWKQIRDINPSQVIGCYAEVPATDYWSPVIKHQHNTEQSQDSRNQWKVAKLQLQATKLLNKRLFAIAEPLSIICPSLYLHYEQHNDDIWAAYARWNISQAKQYGKPVYATVWPRYHGSLEVIELHRWRKYIDVIKDCDVDGLIVWDYSGHGLWSEVESHFMPKGVAA